MIPLRLTVTGSRVFMRLAKVIVEWMVAFNYIWSMPLRVEPETLKWELKKISYVTVPRDGREVRRGTFASCSFLNPWREREKLSI